MAEKYTFKAVIQNAGGGGAYVIVPYDIEKLFGKKRLKIKATIEGEPYRGTLVRMGSPDHMLLILKEIREKVGKSFGDEVNVEFEEDVELRRVEMPTDFQQALEANPAALEFYNRLSFTHQREYVKWVLEAKREQTRQDRLRKAVDMLARGKSEH